MGRRICGSARVAALTLVGLLATGSAGAAQRPAGDVVAGEVIVRFAGGYSPHKAADLGATLKRRLGVPGMVTLKVNPATDVRLLAARLARRPGVLWAEPNARLEPLALPNDSRIGEQWGLDNTGQVVRGITGIAGVDADVAEAWDTTTGGDAVVAVVDTGVAYSHPDLAANVWVNPGESGPDATGADKRTNTRDDDGNGLVDDWHGWNFVNATNDPSDLNGHGTQVAGIVGAVGGNGQGVSGVSQRVRIMPLKVGGSSRTDRAINADAAAAALAYAGRMGARVVNGSYGGTNRSQAQEDAIAQNPGTLYVFAAGNSGGDDDATPVYPCNYAQPNILCVTAITSRASLARFADVGVKTVDLGAPGSAVLTTSPFTFALDEPFETPLTGRFSRITPPAGSAANGWGLGPTLGGDGSQALTANGGNAVPPNTGSAIATVNRVDLRTCKNPTLEFEYSVDYPGDNGQFQAFLASDRAIYAAGTQVTTTPAVGDTGGKPADVSSDVSAALTDIGTKQPYIGFVTDTAAGPQGTGVGPAVDDLRVSCTADVLQGTEYQHMEGTSAAAAMVTGAAALASSQFPAGDMAYLRSAILGSVTPTQSLAGKTVTGGRLNVRGAIDTAGPNAFDSASPAAGATTTDPRPTFSWNGTTDGRTGVRGYDLVVDGQVVASTDGSGRAAQPGTALALGAHQWRVDAIDGAGLRTATGTRTITVVGAAPPAPPVVAKPKGPALKVGKLAKPTRKALAAKGLTVTCRTAARAVCRVAIRVSKKDAKRLGLKRTLIASGKAKAGRSGTAKVKVKPGKTVAKALRRSARRRGKVTFRISVSATNAAGGKTTKTVKLKA